MLGGKKQRPQVHSGRFFRLSTWELVTFSERIQVPFHKFSDNGHLLRGHLSLLVTQAGLLPPRPPVEDLDAREQRGHPLPHVTLEENIHPFFEGFSHGGVQQDSLMRPNFRAFLRKLGVQIVQFFPLF